jgi:hypothetical protein
MGGIIYFFVEIRLVEHISVFSSSLSILIALIADQSLNQMGLIFFQGILCERMIIVAKGHQKPL